MKYINFRRVNESVSFARNWNEYKDGFGDLHGNVWLGNEIIHQLTTGGNYKLRVELEDWSGETKYAEYGQFKVGSESEAYKLTISGKLVTLITHRWPSVLSSINFQMQYYM